MLVNHSTTLTLLHIYIRTLLLRYSGEVLKRDIHILSIYLLRLHILGSFSEIEPITSLRAKHPVNRD